MTSTTTKCVAGISINHGVIWLIAQDADHGEGHIAGHAAGELSLRDAVRLQRQLAIAIEETIESQTVTSVSGKQIRFKES